MVVIELAHHRLYLAKAILDRLDLVAGNLANEVPLALDRGERVARGVAVGGTEQGLGLGHQFELLHQVGGELLVVLSFNLALDRVEHVTSGLELRPHGVVLLLAAATGFLPLVEQGAIRRDAIGTLRGEALGLFDQMLLLRANVFVSAVELSEERFAVLLDGGACGPKTLP